MQYLFYRLAQVYGHIVYMILVAPVFYHFPEGSHTFYILFFYLLWLQAHLITGFHIYKLHRPVVKLKIQLLIPLYCME